MKFLSFSLFLTVAILVIAFAPLHVQASHCTESLWYSNTTCTGAPSATGACHTATSPVCQAIPIDGESFSCVCGGGGGGITITGPAAGSTVSGNENITATAPAATARVEFVVDGAVKGNDNSTPYSFSWDTTNGGTHACNGPHTHTLAARAYGPAGALLGTSPTVTVNMNNPAHCTTGGGGGGGGGGGSGVVPAPQFGAQGIIDMLGNIGSWIFVIAILISTVMIVIGATYWLTGGDDPNKVATGRKIIMWTVVGLVLALLANGVFVVLRRIIGA